jgi:hypothetical protein
MELYFDLCHRLRQTVLSCFRIDSSSSGATDANVSTSADQIHFNLSSFGLSQSALLCIDIIARQFMKYKEWVKPMHEFLVDFVKLTQTLSIKISSTSFLQFSSVIQDEILKLLGSAFLCCGTLAGISKTKALPLLPVCLLPLPSHPEVPCSHFFSCSDSHWRDFKSY